MIVIILYSFYFIIRSDQAWITVDSTIIKQTTFCQIEMQCVPFQG